MGITKGHESFIKGGIIMKKILISFLIIALLTGCAATKEENKIAYNKITAEQAKEIIDTEEVIILDVRTQEEYKEGHIKDALLIPDYDLENLAESKLPDKEKKILVYCRSGNRSASAAKLLIDMGYTDVHDFGGIINWPYETVEGD